MINRIKKFKRAADSHLPAAAGSIGHDSDAASVRIALVLAELPMSQLVPAIADLTTTRSSEDWTQLLTATEQRGMNRLAAVLRSFLPMVSASTAQSTDCQLLPIAANQTVAKRPRNRHRTSHSSPTPAILDFII